MNKHVPGPPLPVVYSAPEVARAMGVSREMLSKWMAQGRIRPWARTVKGRYIWRVIPPHPPEQKRGRPPKTAG